MNNETHVLLKNKLARIRNGGKPRVLDLFAGAGGLSLGFLTAGFEIVAAVEMDGQAAKTHAINFFKKASEEIGKIHSQPRDITKTDPEDLMIEYGYRVPEEAIDIIIGGPPCQAFARVGRAKLREVAKHPEAFRQDPRANLYLRFIHYVEKLKPLAIVMENVPDALNFGGHNIAEETCEVLSTNGLSYKCAYTLMNSVFYGVPQMRERMILMAYAREMEQDISFPSPTHWVQLPNGYRGTRGVALKALHYQSPLPQIADIIPETKFFVQTPVAKPDLESAVTAEQALGDLPPIYAMELLKNGKLKRGVQDPLSEVEYKSNPNLNAYAYLMRNWPGFETKGKVTGHIIRYLPRDYKLFARLQPGYQYPESFECAIEMFIEDIEEKRAGGIEIQLESKQIAQLLRDKKELPEDLIWVTSIWKEYVPPYDPGKFPNKWRKMEGNLPARTLMAHIGKDSYSHIHYDSKQARTISVREAARIMSFPDGFVFSGKMNAAFRQSGNAVSPLLSYFIAAKIKEAFGQTADSLPEWKS